MLSLHPSVRPSPLHMTYYCFLVYVCITSFYTSIQYKHSYFATKKHPGPRPPRNHDKSYISGVYSLAGNSSLACTGQTGELPPIPALDLFQAVFALEQQRRPNTQQIHAGNTRVTHRHLSPPGIAAHSSKVFHES